ncbi:TPA: ATP-binding protein [Salmonella enterica]|nr:ATP-binding protein [Salmonella enterica]
MQNPLISVLDTVESAIAHVSRYSLGKDFSTYCDLRTTIGLTDDDRIRRPELDAPYIFVTENGDYASVFEVLGAYCPFNEQPPLTEADRQDESLFSAYIQHLHILLASEFKDLGHKLSFVFERDPKKARDELKALIARQYRSTARIGIDLTDIIDEKVDRLTPFVARERNFMVVYTAKAALPGHERRDEEKRRDAALTQAPGARYGQNFALDQLEGLKIRHDAFVSQLETGFRPGDYGVQVRLMDAHEVGFHIKEEVERQSTSADYRPFLPGDMRWPHGVPKPDDNSCLLAPHLNYQLFNSELTTSGNMINIDDQWHASLAITLGPQKPETFSKLFAKINRKIPYRIRMDIMPGGMKALGKKRGALGFLALVPSLRPVYESVEWLAKQDEKDPVVMMTISAATWGKTKEETRRHLTMLQKGLQSWGVCEVTQTFGDPLRAWVSTLMGASCRSGTGLMYPPLSAALALLPLQRPATPWGDEANVVFQTEDGKPYPVQLASRLQTKHTDIVAGDSGTGKSVLLGILNEAIIAAGQNELSYLSMIDKGYTGQGLIRLLQDSLPPERRDEAVGLVLENSSRHCKNPFDVQLGMKFPLACETEYLLSLCESLCIDPETGTPPNSQECRQILSRTIEIAYKMRADNDAVRYAPTDEPDVDAALEKYGLLTRHDATWWKSATWYEVRDMLFDAGDIALATRAHYQAMPELLDVQGYLSSEEIIQTFGTITRNGSGDRLLDYIGRCLNQAASDYKMLSGRTRLMLNPNTRVLAIDLNNVCGGKTRAGQLKTGIMYLFAGQLAAGHFELPQYADELLHALPPQYRAFHAERLTQLGQQVKTKVYDELHNAKDIPFIIEKLVTQDLENRKFGIRTVLSSQFLTHFPPSILRSANSLYLMQIAHSDLPLLTEHFGVPLHTAKRFMHVGTGPRPDGSGTNFLAVYRLTSGRIVQILKNTVGPRELWALNSTPADCALRNRLYDTLSGKATRDLLARHFPGGSAMKVIEKRQKEASESDHDNVIARLADELVATLGYNL